MNTFVRDRFTWLAYLLLAFYGFFLNILGPITPFLKSELELSYTASSLHFTLFAVGILIVGFAGNRFVRRVGRWRALWTGALGISLGALLLAAGRSPFVTILASLLMGSVGSLILAIIPSALSDQHGELRAVALSEANVVASLLSSAAPLLVGWLAGFAVGWRAALVIAALFPLLLWFVFRSAGPSQAGGSARAGNPGGPPLPVQYWLFWIALVLAVAVEFCMIFWSADFLEFELGMVRTGAAQSVSLFLAAMILGRLAGSRLAQRIPTHKLVSASILVASAGFLVFWRAAVPGWGMAGLFVTGFGVANMYPLTISLALATAGENTILASARATLASGTAILALPLILGRLADLAGIRPAYGVVALLLFAAFLIVQLTVRLYPARQPAAK